MLFWVAVVLLLVWSVGAFLAVHELVHVLLLVGLALLLLVFARSSGGPRRQF